MGRFLITSAVGSVLAACVAHGAPGGPLPSHRSIDSLPMPAVVGPLVLRVIHPQPNAAIAAGDSTFLLGSTGTGAARLRIGGRAIPVQPNGAWLAWIPIPPDSSFELALEAVAESDTVRLALPLQRARSSGQDAVRDSLARGFLGDTARGTGAGVGARCGADGHGDRPRRGG
jgi:N-acetylmuramoyl-L-alanine amidase